jgi:hypothetical protein
MSHASTTRPVSSRAMSRFPIQLQFPRPKPIWLRSGEVIPHREADAVAGVFPLAYTDR